jgi:hypothetical protein
MTLSTDIYLTGNVDPHEVFDFCNKLIGADNPVFTDEESDYGPTGRRRIMNAPGQGFPAWLSVSYRKGGPLAAEDVWVEDGDISTEDGSVYRWLDQKACTVEINFDTGYSYRDEFGGCSDLHGRYITMINLWAEERGIALEWQNEFSGEYFKGTDGLREFGGEGANASQFVEDVLRLIKGRL